MLAKLRFPWLYVIELLLWISVAAGFLAASAFVASKPVAELQLQGKALPPTWEAAVPSHGRFLEGYLVSSHPLAFACVLALLVGSVAVLYAVHRAQLGQLRAAIGRMAVAHKVAQTVVFATVAAMGYVVLTKYLVGVAPA